MVINSLESVQKKPTIKTATQIPRNTYRHSNRMQKKWNDSPHIFGCILHIITRVTKQSRWVCFLGTKSNTRIQAIPPENGPVHVECSIMRNVMASATESELGGQFENCQTETSMITALSEMGHPQPPKIMETDNTSANSIDYGTEKQKISRAIDKKFYWVGDKIRQNHFHTIWKEVNKNLTDHVTKHHPIWQQRIFKPIHLKSDRKRHRKLKRPVHWDRKRVCCNYQSQGNPETG